MFTKGSKPNESGTVQTVAQSNSNETPRAAKPNTPSAPSIISSDVAITGAVVSSGEIQLDGAVDGNVRATGLIIGETGSIKGEVVAETIDIRGHVSGSIRGQKVRLAASAKVDGDIIHASLSIEANAVFEGQVKHSKDPINAESKPSSKPSAVPPKPVPSKA